MDDFLTLEDLQCSEDMAHIANEDLVEGLRHGIIVSNLARLIAEKLGMDEDFCYEIGLAGVLHDIGKLRLSKYLYGRKKDVLQVEEMKYVRMHSKFSYDILMEYDFSPRMLEAIYHHHENFDGSGYPDNLKGYDIPKGARILRTCDVFAALVSDRPYREAFEIETAVELMIDEVKNFDMEVFLAFLELVHSKDFEKVKEIIEKNKEHEELKLIV
ncbi:HD-GYP domain-containing protein [Anaerosporobacter faecicola]|uniref:HD-GYP domain-containing protein n=1 Tax=Anaerosporobacter faecicola TaxID=2718714 RepID=UPI001EE55280|nr:HD domain-containing phosphohydrolase [Anaerosporobacter faecicola]